MSGQCETNVKFKDGLSGELRRKNGGRLEDKRGVDREVGSVPGAKHHNFMTPPLSLLFAAT